MENAQTPLVENATTTQNTEAQTTNTNVAKTYSQAEVDELLKGRFTQDQVNTMIEKRLNREKVKSKSVQNVDNTSEVERYKSELLKSQVKLAEYEKRVALADYQIQDEYKGYVDYVVTHNTNKDKSYGEALKEYMAGDGAKYIKQNIPSTPRPDNQGTQMTDVQKYILDKYKKRI